MKPTDKIIVNGVLCHKTVVLHAGDPDQRYTDIAWIGKNYASVKITNIQPHNQYKINHGGIIQVYKEGGLKRFLFLFLRKQ